MPTSFPKFLLEAELALFFFFLFNRQVSIEEGEGKAQELGVMFIETSAKAGFNIKVAIMLQTHSMFIHYKLPMHLYARPHLKQTNTWTVNISSRTNYVVMKNLKHMMCT